MMDTIINNLLGIWEHLKSNILFSIPAIIIAITVHEYFHALVAYKLGDPTAKNEGRLTLNPIKHLDPVGTLFLIIFGFGWGKPVPIATLNFRNPKRDTGLVSLAGPLSNMGLAIISSFLYGIFSSVNMNVQVSEYISSFFWYLAALNIALAILNLLPIYPLDGSKIFSLFLPERIYFKILNYERYFFIILIVLMFTGVFNFVINGLTDAFMTIAEFSTALAGRLFGNLINSIFGL